MNEQNVKSECEKAFISDAKYEIWKSSHFLDKSLIGFKINWRLSLLD